MKDHPVISVLLSWAGLIGSVTLHQWSIIAGIFLTILTAVYTVLNIYISWRDKVVKHRPPSKWHERSTDTIPLDQLE